MGVPVVCLTRSVVQRRTTRWLIDGAIVLHIVNFVAVFSIRGVFISVECEMDPWNSQMANKGGECVKRLMHARGGVLGVEAQESGVGGGGEGGGEEE
jgi:hypothetical protein